MKSHLFVAISLSLSVVLASRRLFSGHHDETPPVSSRLSPRTGTIAAPSQVIVQGVPLNPATILTEFVT
jgi:hypothetical protein